MTQTLRRFKPGDEAQLSKICQETAQFGGDATGLVSEDRLWGDVFAVPYAVRDPRLAFVIADADDSAIGYVLGTDDTTAFSEWFREVWWPPRAPSVEGKNRMETELIGYAATQGLEPLPFLNRYPAHLHIDLLPAAQGHGWGRKLIDRLCVELASRGVVGVHLGTAPENTNAGAFYRHTGWTELEFGEPSSFFGRRLAP